MPNLRIKQLKSVIGTRKAHRDTLRTLGLKKIGQSVERPDSESVRGMIRTVEHLISFEEIAEPKAKPAAKKAAAKKAPAKKAAAKKTSTAKKTPMAKKPSARSKASSAKSKK